MIASIPLAAAPLAILLWLSGSVTIYTAFGVMLVFAFFVLLAGVLLARVAGAADLPLAGAWVLGVFASALAVYALVLWAQLLAATAFAVWCIVVLAWAFARRRRLGMRGGMGIGEAAGLGLCAVATLAWCHDVAEVPQVLARDQLLPAWIDYFIHGGMIS